MVSVLSLLLLGFFLTINCYEENSYGQYVKSDFNGEYAIILPDLTKIFSLDGDELILTERELVINDKFQIKKEETNDDKGIYRLQYSKSSKYMGVSTKKNDIEYKVYGYDEEMISDPDLESRWYLKKIEGKTYLIQNKVGCFLQVSGRHSLSCNKIDFSKQVNEDIEFNLVKLYEKAPKEHSSLLDETPVDVLIKYIDLSDANLVREGIPQIRKDEDNEELRYSVRSIIKNIPWVRKIFILMPNEKVRYFKDYELIKDKIVYVKDKDLLGFDSASSPAFQFNLWKMKKFGLSEYFILMDDDCFIGKPLNKSDFFYEENGKIFPAIISTEYKYYSYDDIMEFYNYYYSFIEKTTAHKSYGYLFTVASTYKLNYEIFNRPLVVPSFVHNTIPMSQRDLYEIYNEIVSKYQYANETLSSLFRHIRSLQCQEFFIVYTTNRFNRKNSPIFSQYLDSTASFIIDNYQNSSLFCINTGGQYEYSKNDFLKVKAIMEKFFPEPTEYEVYDYTLVPDLCYEILLKLYNYEKSYFSLKLISIISYIVIFFLIGSIILVVLYYRKKIKKIAFDKESYTGLQNIELEIK